MIATKIVEELLCAVPLVVTQRNLDHVLFEHCESFDAAWKGPYCVAIWRIRYKPEFHQPKVEALTRAFFFKKWCEKQKRFEEAAQLYADSGIQFMGDLSQNWSFETFYKVQIGEIKLYA